MLTVRWPEPWLLFLLSGLLMFASPFFTAGRAAILPAIASADEIHTANSLTQTTQWTTLTIGTMAAGVSAAKLGYSAAFVLNALSFVFSAWAISRLVSPPGGIRAASGTLAEAVRARPWHEYVEGLRYMRQQPLILAIALLGIGWASGGGAAQILSALGEMVFNRGPAGIGIIWGCAGLGLIAGGIVAHTIGPKLSFALQALVAICYLVHGGAYVVFSQMPTFGWALVFIGLSRAAVAISSVLNMSILLRHVADEFRGRVFSTNESLIWATMMLSMLAAGLASMHVSPRTIGAWSGVHQLDDRALLDLGRSGRTASGTCRSEAHGRRSRGAAGAARLISASRDRRRSAVHVGSRRPDRGGGGHCLLSSRIGLVPIVGFLIAGVIIGPHALGLVEDPELVNDAAEIGVILLLFTIGIEFSLEKLSRIKTLISAAADCR